MLGIDDRVNLLPSEFQQFDLVELSFADQYRMLSGSVIPRPIALVSSVDENGSVNCAPFSSFMIASIEANLLALSIGPHQDRPKETLRNIRRNGEYVINTVPEELVRQVQLCGEDHAPGVRKIELAGLGVLKSERIKTPRIAGTKIQFECKLHSITVFGESHMVVGEVVLMHARIGLVKEGKIDPLQYGPLGRIAGRNYCKIRELISA